MRYVRYTRLQAWLIDHLPGYCKVLVKAGVEGQIHIHGWRRVRFFVGRPSGMLIEVPPERWEELVRCNSDLQVMALLRRSEVA